MGSSTNRVGIPPVPSGLARDLTAFLQSLAENVRILSGGTRGLSSSRAIREYERAGLGTASLGSGAVGTDNIRSKSITTEKLADGAVTEAKIGESAVSSRAIMPEAVTTEKLAHGVIPPQLIVVTGEAQDGNSVDVGRFAGMPTVCISAILGLSEADEGVLVGHTGLAESADVSGLWQFTAVGSFLWIATGYAENQNE